MESHGYSSSFTLDRKTFTFERGRNIRITEDARGRAFSITLKISSHLWLRDTFKALLASPLNQKFFRQERNDEYVLWVDKTSNRKGHCAEIARLGNNGGLYKILIPLGINKVGWINFLSLLNGINSAPPSSNNSKPTFKQALISDTKDFLTRKQHENRPTINHPPTFQPQSNEVEDVMAPIDLESTVIIYRQCFHDDWFEIIKALRREVCNACSISPIQPDRAILGVTDPDTANTLSNIKGWFKMGKYRVRFEKWSKEEFYKDLMVPSYGGWIKIKNLSIDAWTMENFTKIGDLCGGFIEISKMTSGRMNMLEATINVRGNFYGFIPACIHLPSSSTVQTSATIDPYFNASIVAKYYAGIHGNRPPYSPEFLFSAFAGGSSQAKSNGDENFTNPRANTGPQPTAPRAKQKELIEVELAATRANLDLLPTDNQAKRAELTSPSSLVSDKSDPDLTTPSHLSLPPMLPSVSSSLPTGQQPSPTFKSNISLPLPIKPFHSSSTKKPPAPPILTSVAKNPSRIKPLPVNKTLPLAIVPKSKNLTFGTHHTTPFSHYPSESEDLISSPCSTPIGTHHSDSVMTLSPPNIAPLFANTEPPNLSQSLSSAINPLPLVIDRSHLSSCNNQQPGFFITEEEKDGNNSIQKQGISFDVDHDILPPNFHLVLPWLFKHGLCISPFSTKPKKSTSTKKIQRNIRELQNLHSSINYERQSACGDDGSHFPL